MAILDKLLEFSDAQAAWESTAAVPSTNVIDTGLANANLGGAKPIYVVVEVNTTGDSSGEGATLTVTLQDSADNSSFATLLQTKTFTEAQLVAGTKLLMVPLPPAHRRYIRILYTIGVEDLTAGLFDAYLTMNPNLAP